MIARTEQVENNTRRCLVCDSSRSKPLWDNVAGYDVVRCEACGVAFVDPRPSDDLAEYYSESYSLARDVLEGRARGNLTQLDYAVARRISELVRRFRPGAKSVCEIGCAFGYLLAALRETNLSVKGFELSKATARFAQEYFGLDVTCGEFSPSREQLFDAAIMRHVLEHMLEPLKVARKVREGLGQEGLFVVIIPNMRSLNSLCFGRNCAWVAPPDHLFYFTPKSVEILLRRAGSAPTSFWDSCWLPFRRVAERRSSR